MLLLTSKGAAGVTGSGFITLAATLAALDGKVPVAGVALILGVDRFMSEARAITNIIGNGVATLVVARWEGPARRRQDAGRARCRSAGPGLSMVGDGSFELAFEQRPNYLFVRVSGINGRLDTTIAYWTAIAAEVRRRKPRCLMVHDEMLGETPPPEELQRLIQAMAGLGFEGVRVAYVEAHASQLPGGPARRDLRARGRASRAAFSAARTRPRCGCGSATAERVAAWAAPCFPLPAIGGNMPAIPPEPAA